VGSATLAAQLPDTAGAARLQSPELLHVNHFDARLHTALTAELETQSVCCEAQISALTTKYPSCRRNLRSTRSELSGVETELGQKFVQQAKPRHPSPHLRVRQRAPRGTAPPVACCRSRGIPVRLHPPSGPPSYAAVTGGQGATTQEAAPGPQRAAG
jgi:hypothetical protein